MNKQNEDKNLNNDISNYQQSKLQKNKIKLQQSGCQTDCLKFDLIKF